MSSTIEKALQRQREAQKKKAELEAQQAASASSESPAVSEEEVISTTQPAAKSKPAPSGKSSTLEPFELDIQRLEENGHISINGVRKQINEEYREIKRKLINNAFGKLSSTLKNSNIIMVTSGRPSEGKTFTACNLAMSIAAEQDKTVLLVDADVLKPNVLNTLFAISSIFSGGQSGTEIPRFKSICCNTSLISLRDFLPKFGVRNISDSDF